MDTMLMIMRGIIMTAAMVLMIALPAQANQAFFFSGVAANEALREYRTLAATHKIPELGGLSSDFTISIDENRASATVWFSASGKVIAQTTTRRATSDLTLNHNPDLNFGRTILSGASAKAMLGTLQMLSEHPSARPDLQLASAKGAFIAEVLIRSENHILVNIAFDVNSGGCPVRSFIYDNVTGALSEGRPYC